MGKKIISIINQKGGVGKTTTVINLAAGLSMKGKKILVIDLDPQGNATTGLGLSNNTSSDVTIYNVLNGNKKISEVVQQTSFPNLNLITSNVDLSGLEVETAGDSRRAFKLKDELGAILNDSGVPYDYILIDCPPSLSLLTIMALVASKALVVPLQTEFFALEGLTQLMKTIDRIKANLNPSLESTLALIYLGVFPTGIAWMLRFHLLTKVGLVFQTQVAYLIPLFGVFFGYIIMSEEITWRVLVSLIIIVSGIYIVKKNDKLVRK